MASVCAQQLRNVAQRCSDRTQAAPMACTMHRQPRWGSASASPRLRHEPRRAARLARSPRCQAAGFSQPSGGDAKEVAIPNSREEAIQQAAASIAAQLGGGGGGGGGKGSKSKGFASASCRKLAVDVPVVESGTAAMLQLAQDIVAALPKPLRQQFTVVSCGEGGTAAGGGGAPVVSLRQCVAEGRDLDGCLLIAGPATSQLDDVMRLLAYWRGPGAVALNADWSSQAAPVEQVAFLKSFEAVYCFLPLMVKVLFIGQEGAVFKWCTGGSPAATPWRILGKQGQRLEPIGRMAHRPSNEDLEACFYNAYAMNNPINRTIKAIRGLGDKK